MEAKIFLCILLCLQSFTSSKVAVATSNETDILALLAFKNSITQDSLDIMSSWNNSIPFCNWPGVSCSRRHPGRVTVLKLYGTKLAGRLPPHIGNLSFLRVINLTDNSFHGEIPQEIGCLSRLSHLNLSHNEFEGIIPSNLSYCSDLQVIDLHSNHLVGEIPRWLGNTTSLIRLVLNTNKFYGRIPSEIGGLSKLRYLGLGYNNLSGKIPPSIYNLTLLLSLILTENQLHGRIAPDIGFRLTNLQVFYVAWNLLTGPIPVSLLNASGLDTLRFGFNNFTGTLPQNFGSLRKLTRLSFVVNQLETKEPDGLSFLTSLTNCSNLEGLDISYNRFTGELPSSISNFSSTLEIFSVEGNQISGTIAEGIGELVGLTLFTIARNSIMGDIPAGIGKLKRLRVLRLCENKISGSIPNSLGNITQLFYLELAYNYLNGNIPSSLGNFQHLELLNISNNNLTGYIPNEVSSLSSITLAFDSSHNALTGALPLAVGNMSKLVKLDVSNNNLSGEIPSTISNCLMMETLLMGNNMFEGSIPSSLNRIRSLHVLDLSRNNFSGQFPAYLQNFTYLENLNLSFNNLEGEVPSEGPFKNTSAFTIMGNFKLCGGIESLGLPACQNVGRDKSKVSLLERIALPIGISGLILLAGLLFTLQRIKKTRRKISTNLPMIKQFPTISYLELSEATNEFSLSNLIGEGSYGSVYKGILANNEMIVAVKVLNLKQNGAVKSFMAECNVLRNVRHRNLIRVITTCSSIDAKGSDFKALVYEYMPNGSLGNFIHKSDDEQSKQRNLSLVQRLSIANDIASSLEYLHHHCQTSIVHGDLKPSNVLLDSDMTAHVGDFGLAKFLENPLPHQSYSTGIRGTIGYIAPEYGMGGKASVEGDVYSFGILLLELFTGKRPIDDIFTDDINLHVLAEEALLEKVIEIVDPSLLFEDGRDHVDVNNVEECLTAVLSIGVSCSRELPGERMDIREAAAELCKIKNCSISS